MLEDYYKYKANPNKYEHVYTPLPWEEYVSSKSEEERKRLPRDMVADWQARTIPARKEKILKKAVDDAISGWFASRDPQTVTREIKSRLMELRRHIPIPFTEEEIYNLSESDIKPLIPTEQPQPSLTSGILSQLIINGLKQRNKDQKPGWFPPIISVPFITD